MPEEIRRSLDLSQREQQDLRKLRGLLRRGPDVAHELAAKDSAEVAQEREQRKGSAELFSQRSCAEVWASNLSVQHMVWNGVGLGGHGTVPSNR